MNLRMRLEKNSGVLGMNFSGWKEFKLSDICQIKYGKDHKNLNEGKIPTYGSGGVMRYVDSFIYDKPSVLIPRKGSLSNLYFVNEKFWTVDTLFWTIIDETIASPKFLYFQLLTKNLSDMNVGSAVPSLTTAVLNELRLQLPSLETQYAISGILSSLNDKIELNNKINKTLEEMAQAIFKSWFVDFDPFKDGEFTNSKVGKLPTGWQLSRIGDLSIIVTDFVANGSFASLKENVQLYENDNYAYFIRNVDLKANNFRKFVDKKSYEFLSKSSLEGGEVIISNVGDVGSVYLCPKLDKPMTLGNNIIVIKSKNKAINFNLFLYFLFKYNYGADLLVNITSGSAQPKFNKTDFKNLQIIIPDFKTLNNFNELVSDLINQQENLRKEISLLTKIRDSLLPKLMSGEIRVKLEEVSNA